MLLSTTFVVPLLVAFLLISTIRYIYSRYFSRCALPANLQWIGAEDGGSFSRARATLRSFMHTRELVFEGYQKVWPFHFCSTAQLTHSVTVLQERPPVRPPQYHHRPRSHHPNVANGLAPPATRPRPRSKWSQPQLLAGRLHYAPSESRHGYRTLGRHPKGDDQTSWRLHCRCYWRDRLRLQEELGCWYKAVDRGQFVLHDAGYHWSDFQSSHSWLSAL